MYASKPSPNDNDPSARRLPPPRRYTPLEWLLAVLRQTFAF